MASNGKILNILDNGIDPRRQTVRNNKKDFIFVPPFLYRPRAIPLIIHSPIPLGDKLHNPKHMIAMEMRNKEHLNLD